MSLESKQSVHIESEAASDEPHVSNRCEEISEHSLTCTADPKPQSKTEALGLHSAAKSISNENSTEGPVITLHTTKRLREEEPSTPATSDTITEAKKGRPIEKQIPYSEDLESICFTLFGFRYRDIFNGSLMSCTQRNLLNADTTKCCEYLNVVAILDTVFGEHALMVQDLCLNRDFQLCNIPSLLNEALTGVEKIENRDTLLELFGPGGLSALSTDHELLPIPPPHVIVTTGAEGIADTRKPGALPSSARPSESQPEIFRLPMLYPKRQILHFDPRPYNPSQEIPAVSDFRHIRTPHNTVRYTRNSSTGRLLSNARLVEWSDGSRTLHVGKETYILKRKNAPDPHMLLNYKAVGLNETSASAVSCAKGQGTPQNPLLCTPLQVGHNLSSVDLFISCEQERAAEGRAVRLVKALPTFSTSPAVAQQKSASSRRSVVAELVDPEGNYIDNLTPQQLPSSLQIRNSLTAEDFYTAQSETSENSLTQQMMKKLKTNLRILSRQMETVGTAERQMLRKELMPLFELIQPAQIHPPTVRQLETAIHHSEIQAALYSIEL